MTGVKEKVRVFARRTSKEMEESKGKKGVSVIRERKKGNKRRVFFLDLQNAEGGVWAITTTAIASSVINRLFMCFRMIVAADRTTEKSHKRGGKQ